jgi:hypothetical protein
MSAFTDDYWYRREIVTPELDECCDRIAAGLRIPRSNVGTKGDENHRRGHHRSQEWILNSPFCTNRTYTVQSGLTAEQARHIAAIDIVPGAWGTTDNRRKCAEITARVIAAMKLGQLDEVFEVYGAASDLRTVTGYNNREDRAASSDSSHLDHPHLGIDRRKLRDRAFLRRLASIVIGDDMLLTDKLTLPADLMKAAGQTQTTATVEGALAYTLARSLLHDQALARIEAALAELKARPSADVDEAALAAELAPLLDSGASAEEIAAAVAARFAAKLGT